MIDDGGRSDDVTRRRAAILMPALLVSRDGRMRIAKTDAKTDLSQVELAVSGFSLVLVDGEASAGGDDVHPRTGIGLSRDSRFLVIVVVDGRQPASAGATTAQVGTWLKHFGAHVGINMDGGGSTTLAWWDPGSEGDGKCRLLNRPVGAGRPADARSGSAFAPTERANGNNLGICLRLR